MSDYVIYADSACDIDPDTLKAWGVAYCSLSFYFTDAEDKIYGNGEMDAGEFYRHMRDGRIAKTAAVNTQSFLELFDPVLASGTDIFYLGFSSGLSATYSAAAIAADELREKYPERKILTVDSLAASSGFGLLLYLCVQEKNKGATIEQVAAFAEEMRPHLCHWFTVDSLEYLKRGGRVSPAVALVGGMLGIKPVLHVDDEGHLIKISTVRGRKNSLKALADRLGELRIDKDYPIFISHGDCMDDVNYLKADLKERFGVDVMLVEYVGPVIGAHSGPGTMALFFVGEHK